MINKSNYIKNFYRKQKVLHTINKGKDKHHAGKITGALKWGLSFLTSKFHMMQNKMKQNRKAKGDTNGFSGLSCSPRDLRSSLWHVRSLVVAQGIQFPGQGLTGPWQRECLSHRQFHSQRLTGPKARSGSAQRSHLCNWGWASVATEMGAPLDRISHAHWRSLLGFNPNEWKP